MKSGGGKFGNLEIRLEITRGQVGEGHGDSLVNSYRIFILGDEKISEKDSGDDYTIS